VNTPTTHGSIGLTTGLDPAMTLGCGGWGGNITSDNITPRHLLNIKRLAYELRPATTNRPDAGAGSERTRPTGTDAGRVLLDPPGPALPKAPARPVATGIPADTLASKIDQFLASRGYKAPDATADSPSRGAEPETVADFVCEEDVRAALKAGRKLVIGEKTIVTPSARDLGEAQKVFVQAGWPR
jgi:acetaldehyde dehydrogenase (acetylating)